MTDRPSAGDRLRDLQGRAWLRFGLPGMAGSALIAVGALGIGWLPLDTELLGAPVVEALRGSLTGSLVARSLVFVGLAVLLQAWLLLGTHVLGAGVPLRSLQAVLALWAAPLLLAPPLFSRDVYSYYVQGRLMDSGSDPTTMGVAGIPGWFQAGADPMWAEAPTPYGPGWLLIEQGIASFAHPNAYLAGVLFRLSCVAGVALLAACIPALAARHGVDPGTAAWLGVLNPLIQMHFVSGAHNDALMAGLLAAAFWLATCNRCLWAAVLVGGAIAIKPIAVLALPFIGLLWAGHGAGWGARIRAWLLATLAAASTLACLFLVADAGTGVLSAAFGTPSGVLTWLSPPTAIGQALGYLTSLAGLTADASPVVAVVRGVALLAAVAIIGWLILTPDRRAPLRGAAMALGVIVVLGPVIQPWYLLWFLPLFAAAGLSTNERRAAVLLTAAFTVHGMVESSTTSDNFLDITDGITFVIAIAIVALVLFASPRERGLILGDSGRMRV
ncbi:MAG: polyprenol phosphomannose-dependent alpha 1,6 mannosyltransferase MptB [Actinomycetales bacterium]|nr:polyprenol phosphomannose-dependent alpha 1,6 mannosyltransferase MptB [Actinomycetales bacterium]